MPFGSQIDASAIDASAISESDGPTDASIMRDRDAEAAVCAVRPLSSRLEISTAASILHRLP